MNQQTKEITRFTFDCPTELHFSVKMKALSCKKTVKDYLIGLITKDVSQSPDPFMKDSEFKKALPTFLEKHKGLMEGLAAR